MSCARVLLVEDHPRIQDAVTKILLAECDVIAVIGRGDEVLEAAERLLPDVVVLDIALRGRSSTQLLPELRAVMPTRRHHHADNFY